MNHDEREREEQAWAARRAMVEEQLARRGVKNPDVLAAMRTVPRHHFVSPEQANAAYADRPLPIGQAQTISQPYVVAAMSEALEVGAGDRVLEVGTGTGYQAAVLAEMVSEVWTVEALPELCASARERLGRLRYENVHVIQGDGAEGFAPAAPYQGVLVACGAPRVPPALVEQLAPGRRMVIPVGQPGEVMELRLLRKRRNGRIEEETLMPVRFVPLLSL